MNKYENGKIYKLTGSNGLVYYGSTIMPLHRRLTKHKCKSNTCISKLICDMKIELVENYPCNCRSELEMRERWFIENNECVNITIPFTTKEEIKHYQKQYKIDNKECIKQYHIDNKERKKQYNIDYKKKNKEKLNEIGRQYKAYTRSFIGILARGYF